MILVRGKGDYCVKSECGKDVLHITKDGVGINAMTLEKEGF